VSRERKIDVGGGEALGQNPFAALEGAIVAPSNAPLPAKREAAVPARKEVKKRGRVEIRREKAGRGGKIVTTVTGFERVSQPEIEEWAGQLKRLCGTGGTAKPRGIEIQGDRRDEAFRFFEERGFRPVLAGG
jgi:translation initiation factor 1